MFASQLRAVARHIGKLVNDLIRGKEDFLTAGARARDMLWSYSQTLRPWAEAVADKMVADVARRDELVWKRRSEQMGRELRKEIRTAPTGRAMRAMMNEAVELITSLPTGAAERVHRLTIKGISEGTRSDEIREKILETGLVTLGRAELIARTEVSRTASVLTEVRATHIGSEGYIWRTSRDGTVRPRHRKLEGKFIRWDSPPVSGENGERAHAGQIYNCRCYPEVVLPKT
jgi:SPP1 gp7 family putative phage head morphogenesis protein